MKQKIDPAKNYQETKEAIGYVPRKQATQADYDRIGFMSGLEVHQQLKTEKKLFCRCPAGVYNDHETYDAEVIRHMRPTLSELGEYDGTALMEFKTRKNIVYRIKNETTCTYEVDDTPPFPINRQALDIAIAISLLSKLNIVGEVHITRKQYLDGSIPTGFQRTAIIGVEGEIYLKDRPVRLIQLSIEEDSCREISDIGHTRVYKTDRLGMPLIETVTYPDMVNPDEVKEACDYIRFLNRSTGMVRTGMGAGRQDVNVSCRGGSRVEIKGVAHTRWIPELTHVECFRQWTLLRIREILLSRFPDPAKWNMTHKELKYQDIAYPSEPVIYAKNNGFRIGAVNLPGFGGILSHFTQPKKMFASEIEDRLKVIACIERPNMIHSEEQGSMISGDDMEHIFDMLGAKEDDAQIIFWGPDDDIKTAIETIEERCRLAFVGIPGETRKSFEDGTTIFERVLPGPDRMYPDTDSKPIPLPTEVIDELGKNLPDEVINRYKQLVAWGVPGDTHIYLFSKNLFPLLSRIANDLKIDPKFAGTFLGHTLKNLEGKLPKGKQFTYEKVYELLQFLTKKGIDLRIAAKALAEVYIHPQMDFDSVMTTIKYKKVEKEEILSKIPFLKNKFAQIRISSKPEIETEWIMGELRRIAEGNINLAELSRAIEA
ncbi:MAG: Glu-tRNA(Gln) amidotransferase subunit GatE [Bacteroidetes bacterium]|nr:Glu-tRNA(Gln) amidotransferase subunit GatE [Bacteroidota bacterium]MBU1719169.1 Glu-tRNA(Gln) amidotransferase subunit GatE [Bacteroidota bacterium]